MQNLLALYLTEHRNCPLPGIGTLHIFNEDSAYYSTERVFKAPVQTIKLFREELPANDLVDFIVEHRNTGREDAEFYLKEYCYRLKNDDDLQPLAFEHLGSFSRKHGKVEFHPQQISGLFFPDVFQPKAERKFNDTPQEILVGDNIATATEMSNYYNPEVTEEAEGNSNKGWLIWAAILLALALGTIGYYYYQNGFKGFGNAMPVNAKQETTTYSTGN